MDPVLTLSVSKKRAHSLESPVTEREDRKSKSDIENNEARERKDKKKRKKRQRKMSVVEERDGGAKPLSTSSSRVSLARSTTLDDISAPPRATGKQPEFVQGSSSPTTPAQDPVVPKESFDTQKKSLDAHGALLSLMLPSLTCQICLDLLHKPFVLAPCGHMACYTCLVSWFTTPPANDNIHELPQYRKKTCPHCRAVVRERPAEVWAVKEMVANVSRSGLAPQYPPAPVAADEPAGAPVLPGQVAAVRDAWANIFPPLRQPIPGLGAGGGEVAAMGMYDAEDHVYRCIDCMHEIWEGSCAQCGRIYPGHDDALGLDDDDAEDDVANIYAALHAGHVDGFHPAPMGHFTAPFLSDSDGERHSEDEGSYEGSFIDDDDAPPGPGPRVRRGEDVIELSSGSEDEENEEVRALGRGWRIGRGPAPGPIVISDEEVEVNSDEDEDIPRRYHGRRGPTARRAVIVDDEMDDLEGLDAPVGGTVDGDEDEDEDDDDGDGAIRGPSRRLRELMEDVGSDEEIHVSDDEDVDEDGAIRGPSRRLRDLMGDEDDADDGGESDEERFGDERYGGGSDAGEYGGDYGQFEDEF